MADLRPESEAGRDGPATFRGVARSGIANLIGAAYGAAVNLVLLVLIARSMPPHDAGIVFATTSLFVLVEAAARLGVDVSIVHFLAGAQARNRDSDAARYLRLGLIPVLAFGLVVALVLVATAPAILGVILRHASVVHGRAMVAVIAAVIPLAAAYDVFVGGTRGLGAVRPTVALERVLRPTLQVFFVGAALTLGGGPLAVVATWVAPYVVVGALAGLWLRRLLPEKTSQRETPPERATFWSFTLPRGLAAIAQIALQRLDILLVGGMRGPAAAAVYTAATRFVVVGQLGNQAITYAVQPRLAGLVAVRDLASARRLFRLSTVWLVALTWPLFLVAAVAAPLILDILGSGYHSGRTVMVLLAGAMLVGSGSGLVDIVLITLGKTRWNLADTAAAFAINVTLNILLIPRLGLTGAALAWSASIVASNVIALVQVGRGFRLLPFSRVGVLVMALAGICFGALPATVFAIFGLHVPPLVASVGAGSAVYLAALYRLRSDLHLDLVLLRPARQGSDTPPATMQSREDTFARDEP